MQLLSNETKESLFATFRDMSDDELKKELQSILSSHHAYTEMELFDSPVFTYLDDVFEIIRDVLVYKCLPD